ncbi:fused rhodanese domain-containing protein/hydrolase [Haladaptatus paucihalophilus DX253]|uniref:Fused rhodanese domain-containing protein/hydrolase n=1 Tax=Haladaptatus paucihalophilus DX253 TaxID=797209 RepID=E7QVA6_HALPU|nr:MBL fold metallo-hydrolase [Haladaptatus paucihalophilus]EFW91624.1 fused rhodanese domain-containing protein/hydrolase [Haladaptatus paucihalophilus DX253]SHL22629.1 Glyoxylase, beta-lactamase superfamily II [Haladaptatus paucihalophilus DX253]
MSDAAFPSPDAEVESVTPDELYEKIDAGESVTILDVRATGEYEKWHIDGENVETINVPYFEYLDDPDDELFEPVPEDEDVTVLCAKGGSSEYIAGMFAERDYEVNHLEDGMKGWARVLERKEIEGADEDTAVIQYQRPSSGCLSYLVVSGDEAAVIDPLRAFDEEYVADANEYGADLRYAIDTHVHADHVSGVRTVADDDIEAVVPASAEARGIDFDESYRAVEDGETLPLGETEIEVIHTPGHTTGMTSYRVGGVLFTGDGLFTESVARPDLEEGDDGAPDAAAMLYETLQERVLSLPDDTVVAPAHFSDAATTADDGTYTATVGDLHESMDVLSMEKDEFVEFILSDMPPRPANYEDIIATNLGQRHADDEEAFELELGPNNCAASQDSLTSD